MRSYEFYIKPGDGEYAHAALTLPETGQALISGVVQGANGPEEGALVLLLEQESGNTTDYTFTDELGRFWFGPIAPETLYRVRVQKAGGALRLLELHSL